jgi:hypothetical protein
LKNALQEISQKPDFPKPIVGDVKTEKKIRAMYAAEIDKVIKSKDK